MSASNDVTTLEKWLETLPTSVAYDEPSRGSLSRQQYLDQISRITEPPTVVLAYLQDEKQGAGPFLTLAYGTPPGAKESGAPARIALKSVDPENNEIKLSRRSIARFLKECGSNYEGSLIYILPAKGKITSLDRKQKLIPHDSAGIAIAFLPQSTELSPLILMQLEITRRQFFAEIARSRDERVASALNEMLTLLSEGASISQICELTQEYCRSRSIMLFELTGNEYICINAVSEKGRRRKKPSPIPAPIIAPLIEGRRSARSHVVERRIPDEIIAIVGNSPWMIVPCSTDAVNVLTGQNTKYAQYLIVAIGKQKADYLGNDFSLTDLNVTVSLASLLSTHLPYVNVSAIHGDISNKLDQRGLRNFDLSWLYKQAKPVIPGLKAIAIFPEFPNIDDAKFEPEPFEIDHRSVYYSEASPRSNGACLAHSDIGKRDLSCMIFNASTEYRNSQRIVLCFEDQLIQSAHLQLLDPILEHIRGACGVIDFREYNLATQAQIRHVIRGSLSAAISEVELISDRVRIYSRMPTKLTKLFDTPTMRTGISDALLWLNEAYALADAPRYLLDSFDKTSIRWSDVDPVELVRDTLAINRGEIRRRGLRVELIVHPDMRRRWVSADREFLKIVIFNLIDNAVKYSFQDRHLTIELSFLKSNRWRFEVQNVGVPIDEDERQKIFDPWVRSFRQYLATRRPGTGLGLAVSQRILLAHDDTAVFDFESELISKRPPTATTSFFFELDAKGKGEASRS